MTEERALENILELERVCVRAYFALVRGDLALAREELVKVLRRIDPETELR